MMRSFLAWVLLWGILFSGAALAEDSGFEEVSIQALGLE